MIKTIIKRDGRTEPFQPEKLVHWGEWASVLGADWTGIVYDAVRKAGEICKSTDLHNLLMQACDERSNTSHSKMKGRLYIGGVYKDCFGDINNIPTLKEFYKDMVHLGYWVEMGYTDSELESYEEIIDHSKDLDYTFSQLKQIVGKYSAKDRVKNVVYETPQFSCMRMSLALAVSKKDKFKAVNDGYHYFSNCEINAPTPNYTNLGTHSKGYASCCLVAAGDSAASLSAASHAIDMMTVASAGIGDTIITRSVGDPVRGGLIKHMGKLPYIKAHTAVVNSNTQGGRGGSATLSYTCSDPEVMDLLVARNPTTVEAKRIPGMDFCFQHHKVFRERVARNQEWPLFSYYDEPELFNLMFCGHVGKFRDALVAYERDPSVKKTYVSARKLASKFNRETQETGRHYEFNIDEVNIHTPFKEPIIQTNLCVNFYGASKTF